MKGRSVFRVVVFGLVIASFLAHVLWKIKSGHGGDTYYNYKYQPLTYWGALGTMGIMVVVGLVGLFYRVKQLLERRMSKSRDENR
jgi:hypothetical protein